MYHKWRSYDAWFLRYKAQQSFLSFWAIFCPFNPPNKPENWNFEKMKKTPGDIIILHKCTKNHNHMLYCSWDMVRDRCNYYFFILGYFLPFYPDTPLNSSKNQTFKKMKKASGDIIILQMCTKNYDHMIYGSWDMVCDRRTDRRMDRKTEKVTYRWVLHLKK